MRSTLIKTKSSGPVWRLILLSLLCATLASCALTQSQAFYASDRVAELGRALSDKDFDEADDLIDDYDDTLSDEVALDLAIRQGNLPAFNRYFFKADVNAPLDADGTTPLIRAVEDAPLAQREAIVRGLLKRGADPKKTDNFGRNAVNYASFGGYIALAQFLESGGTTYYTSNPTGSIEWLPELDWSVVNKDAKARSRRKGSLVLRQSPLKLSRSGRPDLLFASAWIPETDGASAQGPFAGLRFYADGTGSVMRFFPDAGRIEPREPSHVAWDIYRNSLYFVALTNEYAAYCRSTDGAAGRFGVSCTNYSAGGGDMRAILDDGLSSASARSLLNEASQRARLQEVGKIESVLDAAADRLCKPTVASKRLRGGLPVSAASARSFGDWAVFDERRFAVHSSGNARVCTQRQARGAALRACRAAGGRCNSVGGCPEGQVTAVAAVEGNRWAWSACAPDPEEAKRLALAKCRQQAGCDCQILLAHKVPEKPKSCGR